MALALASFPGQVAPYTAEIFQKLADGLEPEDIMKGMEISRKTYFYRINEMKKRHGYKTNEEAMADFIRKGLVKIETELSIVDIAIRNKKRFSGVDSRSIMPSDGRTKPKSSEYSVNSLSH